MSNHPRHPRTAISTCSFACRPSTVGGINRRGRDLMCFSRACGRHCCKQQTTQQALTSSCCARFSHQAALSMLMSEAGPEGNFYAFRTSTSSTAPPPTPPLPTEEEEGSRRWGLGAARVVRRWASQSDIRVRLCTRARSQHSSRVAVKKRS